MPDAISLYDFRAQRLFAGDLRTFFIGTDFYRNDLYPPFTSLMHFFLYQVGVANPKIIYSLFFAAFYLVIVGYVKRVTRSSILGLLAGTLIIATPSVWWNSFLEITNVIFMIYLSLAVLYLFERDDNKSKSRRILLGSILLGLSTWVRTEPFWLIPAAFMFIMCIVKKEIKFMVVFGLIVISMSFLWPLSISRFASVITMSPGQNAPTVASQPTYIIGSTFRVIARSAPQKAREISNHFIIPLWQSWGFTLPAFFVVFLFELIFKRKLFPWMQFVTIFLSISILVGITLFSFTFAQWNGLDNSVYRMAIMTIPLYWVCIITSDIWKMLNF
ncbi:MAG: hypothetical protein WCT77_14795 [Bacteroidota bacterium]